MIIPVTRQELMQAATIHSESWIQSHRNVCSAQFLAQHTPQRQSRYLQSLMDQGAQLYMLVDAKPVGIVSVQGSRIGDLYVLPSEQNKGYGRQLLTFAMEKCAQTPVLWVLSTNEKAKRFYQRNGFRPTGNTVEHAGDVYEMELYHD